MRYRSRLRSRIIVSFFLLGFGLTGLFAVATVLLRERLEDQLIGEALLSNVQDYAQKFYDDPDALFEFEKISGNTFSKRRFGNVPFAWRDLPNGVHEITEDEVVFRNYEGKRFVYKQPRQPAGVGCDTGDVVPIRVASRSGAKKKAVGQKARRKTGS